MASFVSHDGNDPQGIRAEVFVQTGPGVVISLEESGNNVNVKLKPSNPNMRKPVNGWLSKDDELFPMLVQAKEQNREIEYRIECQRKRNIDRKAPIAELRVDAETAAQNCRNIFAGFDGNLSREAVTNPAEDPYQGGRIPATGNTPAPQAGSAGGFDVAQILDGLARARQAGMPEAVVDNLVGMALAAGASAAQVMAAGVADQEETPRPEARRAHAKEAAPFVLYNTDGRLNLGSYTVQAAVAAEDLAYHLMAENNAAFADAHNAKVESGEVEGDIVEPQPVVPANAAALGRVFLHLADQVQVTVYGGGQPDRQANSHSRARNYIYGIVKNVLPVPFGQPAEVHEQWKVEVVELAILRFTNATKIATDVARPPRATNPAPAEEATEAAPEAPAQSPETAAQEPATPAAAEAPTQAPAKPEQSNVTELPTARTAQSADGEGGPTPEVLTRFASLATAAGFSARPGDPITVYLNNKFGVTTARKVPGDKLEKLLGWYERKGAEAVNLFREHVLAEVPPKSA